MFSGILRLKQFERLFECLNLRHPVMNAPFFERPFFFLGTFKFTLS